jgi:hypothetical protein
MTANPNNLKNWFQQPDSTLNNIAHLEGTSYYNGNPYTAAQIDAVLSGSGNGTVILNQVVTKYSTATAIAVAGKAVIAGGTGLAMTLAAPVAYALCDINVLSLSSGNVVVTCAAGVTFDGTNNTATFNAAADRLVIGYKSATQWEIHLNNSVSLSSV